MAHQNQLEIIDAARFSVFIEKEAVKRMGHNQFYLSKTCGR